MPQLQTKRRKAGRLNNLTLALHPSALLGSVDALWDDGTVLFTPEHAVIGGSASTGGIGYLKLSGALVGEPDQAWFGDILYAEVIAAIQTSIDDLGIDALVVEINSPGGTVAGLLDACRQIRAIRAQRKSLPVHVMIRSMCCSAGAFLAHAIAGNGGRIICEPTAHNGNAGLYHMLTFVPRMLDKEGIDVRYVAAGGKKIALFPELAPKDEDLAREQQMVDALYDLLCADAAIGLAERRGISLDRAKALIIGQDSATYYGNDEAIAAGSIDAVQLFSEFMEDLTNAIQ